MHCLILELDCVINVFVTPSFLGLLTAKNGAIDASVSIDRDNL